MNADVSTDRESPHPAGWVIDWDTRSRLFTACHTDGRGMAGTARSLDHVYELLRTSRWPTVTTTIPPEAT